MKKLSTLLLFALSTIVIFSCNKKDKAQTQPYAVNGVDDISVRQGEDDSWNLEVRSIGPVYETVTLAVTGLPNGLTATMSQVSGMPTFFSTVVFTNNNALPGSYPCVLTASSPEAGKSTYNFLVKISAPQVCGLLQSYNGTSDCDLNQFISNIIATAPPIEDSINTVQINNFGNEGLNLFANIDCSNNTITIPSQTFGNIVIDGTGSFTGNNTITINYNMTVSGSPSTCVLTMTPRP
jgi:hypothetical protein